MQRFPIDYIEPVFRPPSEAHSLVLPVTNGCSWNRCTYCEMYTAPQKKFRARNEQEVLDEIGTVGFIMGTDCTLPTDMPYQQLRYVTDYLRGS